MTNDAPAPPSLSRSPGPETVFVVDDEEGVARSMHRLLERSGYAPRLFLDPAEALAAVDETGPQVMITDYQMPALDGLDLAERALEVNPRIKVVLVTGAGGERVAQGALRAGIHDYLVKPFEAAEFDRAVRSAFMAHAQEEYAHQSEAWLRGEVDRQTGLIRSMTVGTLTALLNAQEARTPHFRGHSQAVAACAAGIARAMGLSGAEISSIKTAGLLHDIGMIAVPDSVVNKPGSLSPEEYRAVEAHPVRGAEILEPMEHLGAARLYVREHHERLDGTGYPDGKKGDDISLGGQIVALAEAWTAITEDRSYRDRMSPAEALETLYGAEGEWYASDVLRALRRFQTGA